MLSLDARFTLLLLFCSLSTQWLPLTAINAAAIAQRPYQARRSSIRPADFDVTSKKQKVLPWLAGQHHHDLGHVKRVDNPFANFMHTVFSGVKNKMHHHTRSPTQSIVIPSNHGDTYTVHHSRSVAPLWRVGQAGARRSLRKRDIDPDRAVGTISIVSVKEILASLDVTRDLSIIASNKNATVFQLVEAETPSTSRGASNVYLVAQPASSNSSQILFCATYNASPSKPEAMKMKPCVIANNAYTRPDNSSQIFTLDRDSGEIHPTLPSNAGQNSASAQDLSTGPDAGSSASSSASLSAPSAPGSTSASVTGTMTALPSQSAGLSSRQNQSNARNVTLVFIPQQAGSQSVVVEDDDTSSSPSPSGTVSSTVSQSSTSASASSPASSSMSSTDSSSAFRLETASMSSSTSSSVSASASQSAGQNYGGLSVELVGDDNSPSGPSQSTTLSMSSTWTSSPTPSSTSSVSANARLPISKLDPKAVASSIAAAHASSTSLASASSTSTSSASSSASARASETLSAADVSPATSTSASTSASATASASGSQTSPSPSSSSGDNIQTSAKFAAAVMKRAVITEPYQWQFKAESR